MCACESPSTGCRDTSYCVIAEPAKFNSTKGVNRVDIQNSGVINTSASTLT